MNEIRFNNHMLNYQEENVYIDNAEEMTEDEIEAEIEAEEQRFEDWHTDMAIDEMRGN